ncbi:MAG: PEP/pyruvate-binding domain-containing protein, partial [Planctomycetota bacterium]
PYIEQIFKHSFFSLDMLNQVRIAFEDMGDGPLIVRSSSLLEDSAGAAFSGKYRSLFLANTGPREQRLEALTDAIAEVYASVFGPDPIQYRSECGLLDFTEEMGIIIQRVVGHRVGKYFLPAFAGVAFSNNEFRWSPRIRREDGIIRLVAGLGTRAVDRVGDDFPVLVCPGRPDLRVNVTPEEVFHYAQKQIDVLNLETGRFDTVAIEQLFREAGDQFPLLDKVVSVYENDRLKKPMLGTLDPSRDDLVVTFAGLIENTDFVKQMREMLRVLQEELGFPVDVEFAHDGRDLHLLQCRPQARLGEERTVTIPHWIADNRKLFSANRFVTNGQVSGVRYVVYVDAEAYTNLPARSDMVAVADIVSRLNTILPRRSFILMGPGRWGSRGDITLGVGVTYSGISNTQMLIEVARRKGSYVPDLSFGTHFFQDLVESKIRYLALYPDEDGVIFNEAFFKDSPNVLQELLPEYAHYETVVRVIDVVQVSGGLELGVVMDGERDQALGFLCDAKEVAR